MAESERPSPSDREGDTPEDPALSATASADPIPDDDSDLDAALLELAAAPAVSPRSRRALRPEPGSMIAGSYRIERQLGEGGMGTVYLARDLELDRWVALKLQSRRNATNDLARLQREAKAMARLSHPNVVVVHEVGTHEGQVFIAMEYVEGGTAREWIERRPDWRAAVEMLIGAGRGLAAAHEVGIVHRDFKPENVMIGRDGRPRVADFGLAREGPSASPPAGAQPLGDGRLTATGAVLGTPAYMSPEQFAGETVGPPSDQFSFCAMAYEALFGRRPFCGNTLAELADAVMDGAVRSPPARSGVPLALVRIVMRGLRVVPSERHASMAALVDALESIVRARRRRVWLAAAGGVGVVALGLGYRGALALRPEPCEAVDEALGPAWDDARREAVRVDVDTTVVEAIDAWAAAWIDERRAVCEATKVHGERSELEHGLRMACLDRHAARLDGFTAGLTEGAVEVGPEVVDAMLPSLEQCRDVTALEKLENRFDRTSARDSVAQDRAHLEALRLLAQAHTRWLSYRDDAEELVAQAEALAREHALQDVEHAVLSLRADIVARQGDVAQADALRARVVELAAASGEDAAVADAIRLRADAAIAAGDLSAARTHLQYLDLFARRIVAEEPRRRVETHAAATHGQLALAEGKPDEAVGWLERVVAEPELYDAWLAKRNLGSALLAANRFAEAIEVLEDAIALRRGSGIENDPEIAGTLVNLANVRMEMQRYDEAVADLEAAHAIATKAQGDQRGLLGILLGSWGAAERHRGNLDRARQLQEESLRVRTDLLGDGHPFRAYATDELAQLARSRGDFAEAERWLQESLTLRRNGYGDTHPSVAYSLTKLGEVHLDAGDRPRARTTLEEAQRILESAEEKDEEALTEVRTLLARTG